MDYEFKFKNSNQVKKIEKVVKEVIEIKTEDKVEEVKIFKSKKPWFVWSAAKPRTFDNLEAMIEHFLKECKQNGKVKTEFITNNQANKLAIKKSKYIASRNKREE